VAPDRLEPELLRRMLSHRTRVPASGWRQAFLQSWTELGRPDFTHSPLLLEVEAGSQSLFPAGAWERATSTSVRVTLLIAMPTLSEEHARWLMEQIPMLEASAFVQAAAVTLLTAELPPSLNAQARAIVRRCLERVVQQAPGVLQPRLLLLWAESPEHGAFDAREIEALEGIAELPAWRATSLTQTFLEARAHLRETGTTYPALGALSVAQASNDTWSIITLAKRAERTRSQLLPASRQRLGRILWRIGSHLSEDSTVLVRNVGLQLMADGARDMGDEAESTRLENELKARLDLSNIANQAALKRWPLPSLWEEVAEARARDEWAHVREFAGASTPPRLRLDSPEE
jgi:hypothetical protein